MGLPSAVHTVPKVLGMGPEVEDNTFAESAEAPDGGAAVDSFVPNRNHDRPAHANFARVQNAHEVLDPFLADADSLLFSPNHNCLHTKYRYDPFVFPRDLRVLTKDIPLLLEAKHTFHDPTR